MVVCWPVFTPSGSASSVRLKKNLSSKYVVIFVWPDSYPEP